MRLSATSVAFIITTAIRGAISSPSTGSAGLVKRYYGAVVIRDFNATSGCNYRILRVLCARCGALLVGASARVCAILPAP